MPANNFSATKRRRILDRHGGPCFYCGTALHLKPQVWGRQVHSEEHNTCRQLDHFLTPEGGGLHSDENLVPCCRHCNSSKGKRTLEAFRAYVIQPPPHVRACACLTATLHAASSPQDHSLRSALAWHQNQIRPYRFPGELYLNGLQGAQA